MDRREMGSELNHLPPTLTFGAAEQQLRHEFRTWLRQHDVSVDSDDLDTHMHDLAAWQARLDGAGYAGVSWPTPYGGRGLGLAAEAVISEELAASGRPEIINRLGLYTWGPTLMEWGTAEQRERHFPGILDASEIWCQGFSEPGVGSDLASVRTTAVPDGTGFIVNGQKVWTSRARWATYGAFLVRSDPSASRHAGLSVLIIDLRTEGVTVRPLPQIDNEAHFSEVFLDDVRVPASNVIGPVHDGWRVAMRAMTFERGLFILERECRLRKYYHALLTSLRESGRSSENAVVVGRLEAQLEVLRAQVYRTLAEQEAGTLPIGSTSVDKLLMTDVDQSLFSSAYDLVGPSSPLDHDLWSRALLESRAAPIAAGTTEIQHEIIAKHLLGMG